MLEIEIFSKNKVSSFRLSGSFTVIDSEEFEEKFIETFYKKPEAIVIDCKNLNYIDSSGIGAFIKCLHHLKPTNINLHLVDLNEAVLKYFKVAELEGYFNIISSQELDKKYPN